MSTSRHLTGLRRFAKAAVAVCASLGLVLAAGGCGASSGESKTIYFWNNLVGDDGPAMQRIVKEYNAQSDYKVVFQPMNGGDLTTKIYSVMQTGKNIPDIIIGDQFQTAVLQSQGLLDTMDDWQKVAPDLKESSFLPATWKGVTVNGKAYGIPLYLYQMAIYYNKDLVKKYNLQYILDDGFVTIDEIKAYRPGSNSLGSGQVLQCAYPFEKARLVAREMADQLALSLVEKGLVTDQLVLTVGYDVDNLTDPAIRKSYRGPVTTDRYGRAIPKHAHGTEQLERPTSSCRQLMEAVARLFDRVVDSRLLVRRMYVVAGRVILEKEANEHLFCEQLDLFTDYAAQEAARRQEETALKRERSLQEATLLLKRKYGRNALFRGMNLEEGATAMERNRQIGGHRA